MPKLVDRNLFLDEAARRFSNPKSLNRAQVIEVASALNQKLPAWLLNDPARRLSRGIYSLESKSPVAFKPQSPETVFTPPPVVKSTIPVVDSAMAMKGLETKSSEDTFTLVPNKVPGYVPFGHFNDIRAIIKSSKFYPTFVTGLSGNGKTMMIDQICAAEKRECVRVNITKETDEDDLIGGFRLIDGATVWQNGPVVIAMQRGAVLLLDEIDLGDSKLMCLQPILEGRPIYLKKINQVVKPSPGFNIMATANTKGKGSDDGRFVGTNVMNEAFLERFPVTFEQEYPSDKTEEKILNNQLQGAGADSDDNKDFTKKLVKWADISRKTFAEGAINDIISTRRLVHIIDAFLIFGQQRGKAIQLCLNRFDTDTAKSFMDLYEKIDDRMNGPISPPTRAVGPSPVDGDWATTATPF